jgi:hypothetical protein
MKAWLRKNFLSDWTNAAVEDIRTGQILDSPTVKATAIQGVGTILRVVPAAIISEIPEDFGVKSIVGPVFTVYGGEITVGLTGYTCSDTALTVTTATSYLGWDFNIDTSRLSIVNFGSTLLRDPAHIRKWLYKVALNGTAVSVTRLGRLNGVFPANMG